MGLPDDVAESMEGQLASIVPLQGSGEPREVAMQFFLASDESSYVLCEELMVDGRHTTLIVACVLRQIFKTSPSRRKLR